MKESHILISALKRCLKQKRLTYLDVAKHLKLSEASVKRLFSQKIMSITRLEEILSLMDMRLIDLLELLEEKKCYVSELTPNQEISLLKEPKLLLTLFLLLNRWSLTEIYKIFDIQKLEMTQVLAKLDKLKLIELLPENKVKLLTANNFTWQKNGPVQKFFEEQVLSHFFKDKFKNPEAKLIFLGGTLSEASIEKLKILIDEFSQKINNMIREDLKLPLDKRSGIGVVCAMRKWELPIFSKLRRKGPVMSPDEWIP